MLLGLLYAHSVIYLTEHTLFQVVAQLWTCDLCICFKILGVGFFCFCFVCFLNDILEFELANILLLLRDLNVTVSLL